MDQSAIQEMMSRATQALRCVAFGVVVTALPFAAPAGAEAADPRELLSPLPLEVVEHLREVVARGPDRRDDVFAKVGDSATVNRAFVECFAYPEEVDLGKWDEELGETVERFREGRAGVTNPFKRDSAAAKVGWSTWDLLSGHPEPLVEEVNRIKARYALVLIGTNELENANVRGYARRMMRIVDRLTRRGVIPILYTLGPRNDDAESDKLVWRYNLVVEAIARDRKVPWIDLHEGLLDLPQRGVASDGLHPSAPVRDGRARGCDLSKAGLEFGQNLRNLLTLLMLQQLHELVIQENPPAEEELPSQQGSGTPDDPFRVEHLPYARVHRIDDGDSDGIDSYPGCDGSGEEAGPEQVFLLELEEARTVRAAVLYGKDVDVDIHLLGNSVSGDQCKKRHDRELQAELEPGVHHLVVDTFSGGPRGERPGEYVLVLDEPRTQTKTDAGPDASKE